MRSDMKKLLCEQERISSSAPSYKTGKRLDPRLDYDSLDFDWGPSKISTTKKSFRLEGKLGFKCKSLNENLNPLENFLHSAIGRPWNDVYSEICENINPKKAIDFHILFHLKYMVALNVDMIDGCPYERPYRSYGHVGLYVNPETGILSNNPREVTPVGYTKPPDSIHWYDNFWFKKETFRTRSKCGCFHFKDPNPDRPWCYGVKDYYNPFAVCVHGNKPIPRELWYVVEYGYHAPSEVYKTYHVSEYGAALRYGLTPENPTHNVYYRDVPEKMKEPFEIKKKSANKKELKVIKALG